MRKINSIITIVIGILLADHVIFGTLHLLNSDFSVFRPTAYLTVGLALVHGIISIYLRRTSLSTARQTKAVYPKENWEFWLRMISGIALLVLVPLHIYLMSDGVDGRPRASSMRGFAMIATLLMPICLGSHLFSNVRPLLIALGIRTGRIKVLVIRLLIIALSLFAVYGVLYRSMVH